MPMRVISRVYSYLCFLKFKGALKSLRDEHPVKIFFYLLASLIPNRNVCYLISDVFWLSETKIEY